MGASKKGLSQSVTRLMHGRMKLGCRPKSCSLISAVLLVSAMAQSGCQNIRQPESIKTERMTVASAQRFVRIGMSSSAVVEALGSPNLVTTDERRRETWAYDKVSSDAVDSQSSLSTGLIFSPLFLGANNTNRSSRNQRTLTIIVKFDEHSKVRDFAYHSSSF